MIPSSASIVTRTFAVYQRGLVIDSQHKMHFFLLIGSISKGIGD